MYLIIGQSNAAGLASVKDLVPPATDYVSSETRYPNVQIYAIYGADPGVAGGDDAVRSLAVPWSRFARWSIVKPGFGFKNLKGNEAYFPPGSTVVDLFGPEVSFSRYLGEVRPKPHFIVKLAVSNVTLARVPDADNWAPGSHLYRELLKMVAGAHRKKSAKFRLHVSAVFFVQGESDALRSASAAAYEKNLARFIRRIRADLHAMGCSKTVNIPFIMSRVHDNPAWPYREAVRRAQERVSRTQARVKLIDTDDLRHHMTAGNRHFNEYGQVKLGERFFRTLHPGRNGKRMPVGKTPAAHVANTVTVTRKR